MDAARIALVGICLGGGYAVRAAAADPRVRAVAAVAGAYNSPVLMLRSMGTGSYRSALAAALDRYDEYLPAVAADGGEAAMAGQELYAYSEPYVTQAVQAAAGFFRRKLTPG